MNRPRKQAGEPDPPIKGRVQIETIEDEAAGAELFRAIRWAQELEKKEKKEKDEP